MCGGGQSAVRVEAISSTLDSINALAYKLRGASLSPSLSLCVRVCVCMCVCACACVLCLCVCVTPVVWSSPKDARI